MSSSSKVSLRVFREQTGLPGVVLYALLEKSSLPIEFSESGEIVVDSSKLSREALEASLEAHMSEFDLSESSVLAEQVRKVLDEELEIVVSGACEIAAKQGSR